MYGLVRFFAQWERVTAAAAVAAPLFAKRLRFKVCRKAPCRAHLGTHLRSIHTSACARRLSLPTRPNQQGREHDRPQARFAAPRSYAEHVRAACATSAEVSFSARDTIQRPRDGRHQTLGAECGGVTPAPTCRRHQSCLCCIMLHSVGLRSLLRTACCGL